LNSNKKIFHIVHIDNLPSIIADGYLLSDVEMRKCPKGGVTIGMEKIKERRLSLKLSSHSELRVGECVPFYFCPRSIMLYLLYKSNSPDIEYRGGQEPIIHLVSDLNKSVEWAEQSGQRWAFTTSNAGARYFEDYADLNDLNKVDWAAVGAMNWSNHGIRENKQAEFLMEGRFPWALIDEIGVYSQRQYEEVSDIVGSKNDGLRIRIRKLWYY